MKPQKPIHAFRFRVVDLDGTTLGLAVEHASTCFLARAALAVTWGCDPDLIRPEPRRVMT